MVNVHVPAHSVGTENRLLPRVVSKNDKALVMGRTNCLPRVVSENDKSLVMGNPKDCEAPEALEAMKLPVPVLSSFNVANLAIDMLPFVAWNLKAIQ